MHYNTLSEMLSQAKWAQEIDELSVYHAFEQVTDGRHTRGVRYSVALVLTLIVLGKVTGMTTLTAIAEWVRWRADWLSQVLPGARQQFPCTATYSNVLRTVDAEQVTQLLASFLIRLEAGRRCGTEPSRLRTQPEAREQHAQVALDGKTLRGTLSHAASDQRSQHLVALYETQTGVVLAQQAVPDKGNEISLEASLLTPAHVQGRIVTADALHTQRACCATISRFGGAYVFLAKGNQPTLEEDLRLFFSEPPLDCRDWRQARTWDKGHGRLELRELVATTELNEWLEATWPGVEQVFCLQRTSDRQGQRHSQTIYGITNLSPQHASAARLLELVRRHWSIENRLHRRRDVTLGEDQCQVRKGAAPLVLATLNNVVLALFDFLGVANVPQQMRRLDAQPALAVQLVLRSLLTIT
jgi:predicted transposase YbfD/YdcC